MPSSRGFDPHFLSDPSRVASVPPRESSAQSDTELIQALTAGGNAGFTAFYQRFAKPLFSMTYRILGDQKDAEDSLQEAFVQMWKQASTFNAARSGLFTWAVMITRCRAIDRLRQRQRQHRQTESAIAEAVDFVAEARPDDCVIQIEEGIRVKAALALISKKQREVLEFAFFGAMTQKEISKNLKVPLGTVKARIRRGLIALRQTFPSSEAADSYAADELRTVTAYAQANYSTMAKAVC